MNRALLMIASVLVLMLLGTEAVHARTIRCESIDNAYRVCPVDTRGGVRLSQQLSSQGCWQNDTWGYDRNRIWVNRGCRAEFQIGGSSRSSSNDDAVAAALVLGLIGAVISADQHDNRRDNRRDNRNDRYRGNPRNVFRCESRDNRFTYCRIPRRGHVEIYKRLSSSACVYGHSWGSERNRIWVSHGCRAEFAVY
jgi:hypothetical protein